MESSHRMCVCVRSPSCICLSMWSSIISESYCSAAVRRQRRARNLCDIECNGSSLRGRSGVWLPTMARKGVYLEIVGHVVVVLAARSDKWGSGTTHEDNILLCTSSLHQTLKMGKGRLYLACRAPGVLGRGGRAEGEPLRPIKAAGAHHRSGRIVSSAGDAGTHGSTDAAQASAETQ
jgi:hypothetical protein